MSKEKEKIDIGLDIGSVSLNTVLIDEKEEVIEEHYTRMFGQPVRTALRVLNEVLRRYPQERIERVAVTGSGGKLIAELIGAEFINEIIAQARAVKHFYPQVRTIIDIGGEDSKLIILKSTGIIKDFSMNTICAAGTGSFLDQQATRLGLSIEEEFGRLALKSQNPPRIAGRCSVFAKTDMIHLQQEAAPDYDIVAGLCYAMARNFKSSIGKGKEFKRPIIFQGGVAANRGMVKAFQDVLEVNEEELIVPKHYASMGAIGASLILQGKRSKERNFRGLNGLEDYLKTYKDTHKGLSPLSPVTRCLSSVREQSMIMDRGGLSTIDCYLGIDVGSISTNVVAIDEEGKVVARRYLMTAGRPLEAVRQGIREIGEEMGERLRVRGVGTTGSGRYLIGDFVGADIVKNEITAQATAAAAIDPKVDTIFEIGGQDSKYIGLEGGVVVDFEMNKVCAAGTGSFLEEQAEKVGINIKEEFGRLALEAKGPVHLGERCTVFMETNLVSHQQKGIGKEDLVAGLSYSIVENYLNRVVGDRKIGNKIFFQGAVALNQGVVAAFEKVLGKKITVPPNTDVTGAIGVALCAQENKEVKSLESKAEENVSRFKGFENIARAKYELRSFECSDCPNHCEVREVMIENESSLFYGSRCEKYNVGGEKKTNDIPDLFAEREKLLLSAHRRPSSAHHLLPKIGIPRALIFHELYPLWQAFFAELDFEVVLSDRTNKRTIHEGLESVVAETCFPIKVAHGHVLNLIRKKVDYIFLPHIINMKQTNLNMKQSFACPYIQAIPYFIRSAIDLKEKGIKIIDSVLAFGWGGKLIKSSLRGLAKSLGKKGEQVEIAIRAAEKAQESFYEAVQARGREVLNSLDGKKFAVVIVSRPYNGCDTGINLNLPKKLRDLGALPIPMDYLPLDTVDLSMDFPDMYWRYGQKILNAARIIHQDKRLQALYITNFGCGPDSFISRFFQERLGDKPYLQIEIDEHSADVGAITRCEAFLDSLSNVKVKEAFESKRKKETPFSKESKRTVYIPWMGDHAFVWKAVLESHGVPAEVFPESDAETLKWGRKFTSGKECYPCILTTGDMVKIVKKPGFDPRKAAFFMPTANGPCRFGQYHKLQRIILDELGCEDVPILAPNQGNKNMYKDDLGLRGWDFARMWDGVVAVDLFDKMAREYRPYEVNKGETGKMYQDCLNNVCQKLREKRSLAKVLKEAGKAFREIKTYRKGEKPKIGIVGEIFVRTNKFSNDYLVSQVERLGGEVWMPPFAEWLFHINGVLKLYSWLMKDYRSCLSVSLRDKFQQCSERRLARLVADTSVNGEEPHLKEIWRNASPYLPSWFGESALSLGKSVDYVKKGLSGIVNVMPFTCLMGMITIAALKRFCEDYNDIPCLTIAYDGLEQTNATTRLEAFIYQANQYQRS